MALDSTLPVAPVPLLDRLVDEDPESSFEPVPLRTLDNVELRRSIALNVYRILSTRSSLLLSRAAGHSRDIMNYGLPNLGDVHPNSVPELAKLERAMEETIGAYEPRLANIDVVIPPDPAAREDARLNVTLRAIMISGRIREPVSFDVDINWLDGAGHVK